MNVDPYGAHWVFSTSFFVRVPLKKIYSYNDSTNSWWEEGGIRYDFIHKLTPSGPGSPRKHLYIIPQFLKKKQNKTKQNKQTNNFTQWNENKNGTYKLGNALITSVVSRFLNPWS